MLQILVFLIKFFDLTLDNILSNIALKITELYKMRQTIGTMHCIVPIVYD